MEFLEVFLKTIRVIGAIGIIAFVPGFVFSFALFPPRSGQTNEDKSKLNNLERFFISIISSLSISAISAYILYRAGIRLAPGNMLFVLSGVTVLALAWAIMSSRKSLVRSMSREEVADFFRTSLVSRARAAVPLFVYSVLFILGLSLIMSRYSSADRLPLTEFYIQADYLDGQGAVYSFDGETLIVPVAITNHGNKNREYRIEGLIPSRKMSPDREAEQGAENQAGAQTQVLKNIMVQSEDTQAIEVSLAIPAKEAAPYADLLLFEESESEPIARLRIWLAPENEYANP